MQNVCSHHVACQNKTEHEKMNKLWKLVILCTGCLSLMAADSALADYVGLVHVTKADEDTVNLCNNANGVFVGEELDVCNVLVGFDNPADRLLNVGNADVQVFNGANPDVFFHHIVNNATLFSPPCVSILDIPDLICDTFITIGYKCAPSPAGTDQSTADPDFDPIGFAFEGHVAGGWLNFTPTNGQGDAGTWPCLRVLFLQMSVPTGFSITGTIDVFAKINDVIVAFVKQVVDCSGAQDCPQGEACYDCDPCTVDDTCDADGNCVGTLVECKEPGEVCVDGDCVPEEGCPPGKACNDGNPCTVDDTCDADENCIGTPVDDGTACGDPGDTECDNPDSCLGGACQDNNAPAGDATAMVLVPITVMKRTVRPAEVRTAPSATAPTVVWEAHAMTTTRMPEPLAVTRASIAR